MGLLGGMVAILTSASRGLGRAIARDDVSVGIENWIRVILRTVNYADRG